MTPTGIKICTYGDAYVGGMLYAGESGFACVREEYLAMLPERKNITLVKDMIIVNELAVLPLTQDEVWSENPWIARYEGSRS